MPKPTRRHQKPVYFNPPELINRAAARAKSMIWRILADYQTSRLYKLRSDLRETMTIILQELVHATSLEHNGAIVSIDIDSNKAKPMLVGLLVHRCGIPARTVERCLQKLVEIGLLRKTKQYRSPCHNKQNLKVSAVHRFLTDKFWHAVGLLHEYKVECRKRSENPKTALWIPQYIIANAFSSLRRKIAGIGKVSAKSQRHNYPTNYTEVRQDPGTRPSKPLAQQLAELNAMVQAGLLG